MNSQHLVRARLRTHRLTGAPFAHPRDVVQALGAVQAQEFAVARWSLGRRARGTTGLDVDGALADGTILRTHLLRPTWHFVAPADIRWLVTLTAPRVRAAMAPYDRKLGLTEAVFARGHAAISRALEDGAALTRAELATALRRAGLEAAGQRLGHFLMRAELDALICSGPPRGAHHTYALLEARVTPTPTPTRDQALGEAVARYFTGHGPATVKDFTWWSSLTTADAQRGLAIAGSRLEKLIVDDRTFFASDGAMAAARGRTTAPAALLLQGYDEYIIGYRDTRWLLNQGRHAGVLPPGQAMFTHAVVIDGQVVGHWRRIAGAKDGALEAFFTRAVTTAEKKAVAAELARYGRFLGQPARLTIAQTQR